MSNYLDTFREGYGDLRSDLYDYLDIDIGEFEQTFSTEGLSASNYINLSSLLINTPRVDKKLGSARYLQHAISYANPELGAAIQLGKFGAEAYLAITE